MKQHFLIIRFSSIGDIVLTSPLMRCLKNQYPDCHITFVTKKTFESIVRPNPNVDVVIAYHGNMKEIKVILKERTFHHIFDLHNNLRSKRLSFNLNANYQAFHKLNIEKWLMVQFKINRLPPQHIVHRYVQTAHSLGVEYDGKGLDFYFDGESIAPPLPSLPYIALSIGGQHATKRMPIEKIESLIASLKHPVVLIGGKDESKDAELLHQAHPNQIAFNYCGKSSLFESAHIIKKAALLITHDTGMMHIGAALNIPIFSIWGNTIPEFGMAPLFPEGSASESKSKRFEVMGLPCRPCSKIGYSKCPKGHFHCMMKQDTESISREANLLLTGPA